MRYKISAAQRVYLDLRQKIVGMAILPGSRIVEQDIASEHSISRTPVHEAVQKLAEEGLIEVRPRFGTFVSKIPLGGLEEAMFMREALECAVVERVCEIITPEGIETIEGILKEQEAFVINHNQKGFHKTDEEFHAALASIAGYPGIWRIILNAKMQVDRFRQLTLNVPGHMEIVLVEHKKILSAIIEKNAASASAAMREHMMHLRPGISLAVEQYPDYFSGTL
ncbi:GntR family transcriptional regulator [Microvirga sp. W0021]|uniref:GntR family transcriptional regulator n=1 Tax=Hohaiivirga grylli TaxID=3133970 RepID=A0ABV0BJF3_9HYPH